MYLLEIDRMKNRVHLTLSDRFDQPQAVALFNNLRQRLPEVQQDFHVLCDLSSLEEFDADAKTPFREMMDFCNENEVGKIVRIIPNPLNNFGLNIMSHFHYGDSVKVINCKSFKEALKHL